MQLFILDRVPTAAARMLCDIHLRKMCLETAQILSSVMINYNIRLTSQMPRAYNPRHPVIKALNNHVKINWTVVYNFALHSEYHHRFDKFHCYHSLCQSYAEALYYNNIENIFDDSFARNFKDIQINTPDIVEAYREYYRYKKTIIRQWHYTDRMEPEWLQ